MKCVGCNFNGEADQTHEADVLLWRVGDRWVPCCSDRALDWWDEGGEAGHRHRVDVGAPDRWIRPLSDLELLEVDR
jgi:hypothetical protein